MKIRRVKATDFEEVLVLLRQLWPTREIHAEPTRTVFQRILSTPYRHVLCAVMGDQVVGYGSITIKDNLWQEGVIGFIDEMVVHESVRGQGIGKEILEHLLILAREHQCKRVELDSAFHRLDAHRFYERLGFEKRAFLFTKELWTRPDSKRREPIETIVDNMMYSCQIPVG